MSGELEALWSALEAGAALNDAVSRCLNAAHAGGPDAATEVLRQLGGLLEVYAPARAAPVALLAGALVEAGAHPLEFPMAVFDDLVDMLEEIPSEEEYSPPDCYYDYERAAAACLSRSPVVRRALPQRHALTSAICRNSERYGLLGRLLAVLDDEPLLVVHEPTSRAWHLRMSGLVDNFQLHTLLLDVLGDALLAMPLSPTAVAAMRDGPATDESIVSHWQLSHWTTLARGSTAHPIWGEGVPADILMFEGTRVVVIDGSTTQRSWQGQRMFPDLHARLDQQAPLSPIHAGALIQRMRAAIP